MQNPNQEKTEVKPGIAWAKTCINAAKTVWGVVTVIAVPILAMKIVYKIASFETSVGAAAWKGSTAGFMVGAILALFLFIHIERKIK